MHPLSVWTYQGRRKRMGYFHPGAEHNFVLGAWLKQPRPTSIIRKGKEENYRRVERQYVVAKLSVTCTVSRLGPPYSQVTVLLTKRRSGHSKKLGSATQAAHGKSFRGCLRPPRRRDTEGRTEAAGGPPEISRRSEDASCAHSNYTQ